MDLLFVFKKNSLCAGVRYNESVCANRLLCCMSEKGTEGL